LKVNKIGRNEPCPCGSGIKYKNCCLRNDEELSDNTLKAFMARFIPKSLLATLGGLQLWPPNHAHTIRLQETTRLACSLRTSGKSEIELARLIQEINSFFPYDGPVGCLEDPPEHLFTENMVFHGGNYIIYPGISYNARSVLQNLLFALYEIGKDIPNEFIIEIQTIVLAVLSLSNEVARRAGHTRYMDSPNTWRQDLDIISTDELNNLRNAVQFTSDDLEIILTPLGVGVDVLSPLITKAKDQNLFESSFESNPLLLRPLIECDSNIILVIPGSLVSSLGHHIWFTAKKYGILDNLIYKYRTIIKFKVHECLRLMLFSLVDVSLPAIEDNLPMEELLFEFDYQKLAYIQIITDDGNKYDENHLEENDEFKDYWAKIDIRRETITKYLIEGGFCNCKEVFLITIMGYIGRGIFVSFKYDPDNTRTLILSFEDLEVISRLRKSDNLTLWKFAGAKSRLPVGAFFPQLSQLDIYSLYLDHFHSFNISDDSRLWNKILVEIGCGLSLRIKAARTWDTHGVLFYDGMHLITVHKYYQEDHIPIYYPEDSLGRYIELLVDGYKQVVWIVAGKDQKIIPQTLYQISFNVCEMIAYWIWQFTPSLRQHLEPLGEGLIELRIDFENPDSWVNDKMPEESLLEPVKFVWTVEGRKINFTIPEKIMPWFQQLTNEGERLICAELLRALNVLLIQNNLPDTLNDVVRQEIINSYAPSGLKKKLFLLNIQNDVALDPNDLTELRLVQEHDIEEQLEGLVYLLGSDTSQTGPIEDLKDRLHLCEKIVDVYYERITDQLQEFNWKPLQEKLIAQHEAVWFKRANMYLTIPSSIACYTGLDFRAKELMEEIPSLDRTAITIRTLLEIVTAQPPSGRRIPSMDDYDRLLAITLHLNNWAHFHDQIYYKIFDHGISILKSGRIGIKPDTGAEKMGSFLEAKTHQSIVYANDSYQHFFNGDEEITEQDVEVDPEFEKAFIAEFGFSAIQFTEAITLLSEIGFEKNEGIVCVSLSELKHILNAKLSLSINQIDQVIELLSLGPRPKWEEAPAGFDQNDIWPWKYNRHLSYIRRPLIRGPEPEDNPPISWGPRHVRKAGIQLFDIIFSGSYKASSSEMKAMMGKINNKKGKNFNRDVFNWFKENTQWIIDSEVQIKPGKSLSADEDLGDIDVLIIDSKNRRIFSIECKNIGSGRIPNEIASEIREILGGEGESKALLIKHSKRDEWLRSNVENVLAEYKLPNEPHQVYSMFITKEEMPVSYLREVPFSFVSFSRLKREGVDLLNRIK